MRKMEKTTLARTFAGPPELPLRPVLPPEIPIKDPINRAHKTETLQYVSESGAGISPGTTGGNKTRAVFPVELSGLDSAKIDQPDEEDTKAKRKKHQNFHRNYQRQNALAVLP